MKSLRVIIMLCVTLAALAQPSPCQTPGFSAPGPKMEDVLFAWKITGHYRYFGPAGHATQAQTSKVSIRS